MLRGVQEGVSRANLSLADPLIRPKNFGAYLNGLILNKDNVKCHEFSLK